MRARRRWRCWKICADFPASRSAALASSVPLGGQGAIFYSAEGMGAVDATNRPRAYLHRVSPGYVETIGLRLIEGARLRPDRPRRQRDQRDGDAGDGAAFWPGAERDRPPHQERRSDERESVVDDRRRAAGCEPARHSGQIRRSDPDIFLPFNERSRGFAVLLKTSGDPSLLIKPASELMRRRDAGVAVFAPQPLTELVDQQLAASRFLTWLTACSPRRR